MKQILDLKGKVIVEEVPAPSVEAGRILVQTAFSCISAGTELSGLRSSATPIWRKALDKPQHVSKVLQIARQQGLRAASAAVESKVGTPKALGYSLSGVVVDVGEGVSGFKVGDRVACAGAQCANHAEFVSVPVNLAVHIPSEVRSEEAASVALGSIALQGVRRLEPTLGETFLVIGLGVLGQMTAQLLKANGCRVLGIDLEEARTALAINLGMDRKINAEEDLVKAAQQATNGVGVDGVIITASGNAPQIISQAFQACRKKGRVVLVGDVPLNLRREDMYEKELDFRISTSYGPGRYDRQYEEMGIEYPISQVRWTETRNMEMYLDFIGTKRLRIAPLIQGSFPIEKAEEAFSALKSGSTMTSLLSYPQSKYTKEQTIALNVPATKASGKIPHLAIIGAGVFTENVHLPNLRELTGQFTPAYIVCRTGHKAKILADRYGFANAATDWNIPLRDPSVTAVLIGTRHDQHASLALDFLKAGKHVLVEKPLALNEQELVGIEKFYADGGSNKPILLTGFNRRFSPAAIFAQEKLKSRTNPAFIQYTMNAGFLPADHWVHGHEGGGRNIGEACHIYDLFLYLLGNPELVDTKVSSIGAQGTYRQDDNFSVNFEFSGGSVASLLYTAMGNPALPKEELKIFFDSKVLTMSDYKSGIWMPTPTTKQEAKYTSKGHKEELVAFFDGITKSKLPISINEQLKATRMSFEVEKKLSRN